MLVQNEAFFNFTSWSEKIYPIGHIQLVLVASQWATKIRVYKMIPYVITV